MAFSTQRDFFPVAFMNENVELECKTSCVKLKSYESTTDDRSWALDLGQQSKFLSDLVTCKTPFGDRAERSKQGKDANEPDCVDKGSVVGHSGVETDDVVLKSAMAELDDMKCIKHRLQQELEISNELLQSANEEIERMREINGRKHNSIQSEALYYKIQELICEGKLTSTDEKELMCICKKMEDTNRAYDVQQAEITGLNQLVEKLLRRVSIDSVNVEPEESCDIEYLQNEVDCLRKELVLLRQYEDEMLQQQQKQQQEKDTDECRKPCQHEEKLKALAKECNGLRDKCKTFKQLERKVRELQRKANEADYMSSSLSCDIDSQKKYIGKMESELSCMQTWYEGEISKLRKSESVLRCQLKQLQKELQHARRQYRKSEGRWPDWDQWDN